MSGGPTQVAGAAPTMVSVIQWLIDPLVVVGSLMFVIGHLGIIFDSGYEALAIIAFLLTLQIFPDVDLMSSSRHGGGTKAHTAGLLVAWAEFVFVIVVLGYATGYLWVLPVEFMGYWFLVTPVVLVMARWLVGWVFSRFLASDENIRNVVIVGVNDISQRLARELVEDPSLAMSLVGFFEDRGADRVGSPGPGAVLGRLADLPAFVRKRHIDRIYIALPMIQEQRLLKLLDELRDTTASVYFVPDIFMFDLIQSRVDQINGIPVLAVCETPFFGINGLVKKLSDFAIAAAILALVSPLMLIIAIAVKLSSRGPVFFKQKRYGLDGQEINVYKFRSMRVCEDGDNVVQAIRADPRVTPIGAFLRRSSLDELPQLINVLQGRMSLVGPRPHAVAHNEQYRKLIKGYMVRHKVKPGITGWAQVNGLRGETETLDKMKARIEYDLDYLRNWSLALDLKIILKTIWVVLAGRNAY